MNKSKITIAVIAVLLLLSTMVAAHRPILWVTQLGNGALLLEGGFDNNVSAAGMPVYIVEAKPFDGDTSSRDRYLDLLARFARLQELEFNEEVLLSDTYETAVGPLLAEGRLVLFAGELDDTASIIVMKPAVEYLVVFDGGPGHVLTRRAPGLSEDEEAYLNGYLGCMTE